MPHDRGWLRQKSWMKAIRKRRIDRERDGASPNHRDWYNNLHQYSKGKIFCSCPLCAVKTNTNGEKISAQRKLDAMDYDEEKYLTSDRSETNA